MNMKWFSIYCIMFNFLQQCFVASSVLYCAVYKSFSSIAEFIPKYFTLFYAIVNGIGFVLCIFKSYINNIIKYLYFHFIFHYYYGTYEYIHSECV